ncbi:MAG: NUDIX hydrolase [Chlamydiota bacterium]
MPSNKKITMFFEELLDIVDDDDRVVGTKTKKKVYDDKMKNFRVINAFLFSTHGRLWIPRRHPEKSLFPLHLDASVGGHVTSGETYLQAFERELQEELNLSLSELQYKEIATLTPANKVSAFMKVYMINFEEHCAINYNNQDIIEGLWMTPDEVLAKLNDGDKAKSDLPHLLYQVKQWIKDNEKNNL